MRYSTSYRQPESVRRLADEIRFPVGNLNLALSYAASHPDKRVIIEIYSKEDSPTLHKLLKIQKEQSSILYDFFDINDLIEYSSMAESYCKYMFHAPLNSWTEVALLKKYKVSDIIIGEPLSFDLEAVKKNIKNKNITVRVCPHSVVNKLNINLESDNRECHFFALPQEAEYYSEYIDVFDIIDGNEAREKALLEAYAGDKEFLYGLDFLIAGLDVKFNGSALDDNWRKARSNCGQVCMKNGSCHYCTTAFKFYTAALSKMLS